ncbi:ABC transporter substrate-binding protein [Desulfobotulus sp. H1]|uniref:ABC transporter substrate-binding protein n=1 Tax=Desulfobotulus pelophilus TaxID=2823377 RepID=A0ABT3N733_9BACT|nr:ABC transporter substrate-binding protein [Desulfobotulus pelophilus]MCW7753267.1 ABC transporter substrate-binding protein [Desulfobotulus pelophilus]
MRFFSIFFIFIFCTTAHTTPLRVALLPIPDALPFHVAEARGYFRETGVEVEAISVASALERDQLMQAGRIHGMINEMAGTALFNRDQTRMQVLQIARRPMGNSPLFRILASPGSQHSNLRELKDVPIGISRHTIIEYLTDRMLSHAGLQPEEIRKRSVPSIPERFQLLMQGRLEAAVMPDPLAFSAMQQGARELANDLTSTFASASVISFDSRTVREEREKVRTFLNAWNRAAMDINENPEAFRDIFLISVRTPADIRQTFPIPPFPVAEIPSQEQWDDMMNWMVSRSLLLTPLRYHDNVSDLQQEEPLP